MWDGPVIQWLARELKVLSSIVAHGSFLVKGAALSLTLGELLYGI